MTVGDVADHVRSKNAGPFQITIDIFCGSPEAYARVGSGLDDGAVADALGIEPARLRRFELPALRVIKLSAPRPAIQGSLADRDMHGATPAVLVAGLPLRG